MIAVGLAPYAGLARVWDVLLGDRMLPLFLRNLWVLAARHGMRLGRVADVGCGSGSFVLALRRRGIQAVGVDRSPRMVAVARRRSRRARRRGRRARDEGFRRQDLRVLRLDRPVDLITCNFDVLNYLVTEEALARAFRAFAANLVPGGHLLFDVIVSAPTLPAPARRVRHLRVGDLETVWVTHGLPWGVRAVAVWIRGPGGGDRWRRELHVQRAHPRPRMLRALRRAGLHPLAVYDAGTLGPPRRGHPRNVFVARRPAGRRPDPPGDEP